MEKIALKMNSADLLVAADSERCERFRKDVRGSV